MKLPNTPGFFGYVAALGASFATFGVITGIVAVATSTDVVDAVAFAVVYVPISAVYAMFFGFPVALAGVVIIEVCCRRFACQGVHVSVAAAAGLALTPPYLRVFGSALDGLPTLGIAAGVGVAAAAGRWAVIPIVVSRRRLAAAGRLSGTARW